MPAPDPRLAPTTEEKAVDGDARRPPVALVLGVLTVGALALRVLLRANRPMWFDEGFSIAIARGSWSELWAMVTGPDANGALHSLALRVWLRATAVLPWADELARARGMSALAGAATVPVLYGLGRLLVGRGPALAAAALLAVNQLHAYYSNEARGYVLVALLVTLSSWLLVRALDAPSGWRWAAYTLFAALAAYTHVYGGFSVAAQILAALAYPRSSARAARERRVQVVLAGAGVLALVSPMLYYVATHAGHASWISPLRASAVPRFFQRVAGDTRLGGTSLLAALVLVEVGCVAAAVVSLVKLLRRERLSRGSWSLLFLVSSTFVPVVLAVAISLAKPIFVDRYLLAIVPGWLLLVTAGLFQVRRLRAVTVFAALFVLSLTGTLQPRSKDPPRSVPWDRVAAHVVEGALPGDVLVFSHALGVVPFEHHAHLHARSVDAPRTAWPPPDDPLTLRSPPLASFLERLEAERRIWFVLFAEADESQQLRLALEERGHVRAHERAFDDIRVLLYERAARRP